MGPIDKYTTHGYQILKQDITTAKVHMGIFIDSKQYIQAYEIKLERETDCDEAVWCKIVSGNPILTVGLVYRSPNINKEDKKKYKML